MAFLNSAGSLSKNSDVSFPKVFQARDDAVPGAEPDLKFLVFSFQRPTTSFCFVEACVEEDQNKKEVYRSLLKVVIPGTAERSERRGGAKIERLEKEWGTKGLPQNRF